MKILCVASARPNFMKMAPLVEEASRRPCFEPLLVHTGQHYDERMSGVFFRELGLPEPFVNLGVGSGSDVYQIAETMKRLEPTILQTRPGLVLVVGDVNGALAAALAAAKLRIPIARVEAGLRSFDRTMPEEINRALVDSVSDFLFCTERSAVQNLQREGIPDERIFFVGNVMIDSLLKNLPRTANSKILQTLALQPSNYASVTLHRPANVDDESSLREIIDALDVLQRDLTLVFPVHPRTRKNLEKFKLLNRLRSMKNLRVVEPLGYLDFLALNKDAKFVLTDSGGLQEETTVLKIPCVTLRDNTERPSTIQEGSNILAGRTCESVLNACRLANSRRREDFKIPELWDGNAAVRIIDVLEKRFNPHGDQL